MTSRSLSTSFDKPNPLQKKERKLPAFLPYILPNFFLKPLRTTNKSRPRPFLDDIATATARDSFHGPWHGGFWSRRFWKFAQQKGLDADHSFSVLILATKMKNKHRFHQNVQGPKMENVLMLHLINFFTGWLRKLIWISSTCISCVNLS